MREGEFWFISTAVYFKENFQGISRYFNLYSFVFQGQMKFNTFVPFGSLNTLEQNLGPLGPCAQDWGRKLLRVRALSPSSD